MAYPTSFLEKGPAAEIYHTQNQKHVSIQLLPIDVLKYIFELCLPTTNLYRVCKTWNRVLQDDALWEKVFYRLLKQRPLFEIDIDFDKYNTFTQKCAMYVRCLRIKEVEFSGRSDVTVLDEAQKQFGMFMQGAQLDANIFSIVYFTSEQKSFYVLFQRTYNASNGMHGEYTTSCSAYRQIDSSFDVCQACKTLIANGYTPYSVYKYKSSIKNIRHQI